jgi:polyribonucleotide nucleotidyltransferase
MKKIEKSIELGGKKLTISTGHIAEQASGAVMVAYGETVVLATVVAAPLKQDLGYFPLSVEYQERLYAGGRIKGSRWVKREGRPSDDEILTGRLIDRSIRPLFPKEYKKDVQVILTVLSVDMKNPPDVVSAIAASAAISISQIPWMGPLGVIKVGKAGEEFITNPQISEILDSNLDLTVSSTKDAIVMIEAGASQVTEEEMLKAIEYAQKECQKVIDLINDLAKEAGKEKEKIEKVTVTKDLEKKVKDVTKDVIPDLVKKMSSKEAGYSEYDAAKLALLDQFEPTEKDIVKGLFDDLFKGEVRKMILSGKRPDGRKVDEIRPLSAEVGILPRTHGSALFKRGATQVLSITTLGAPSLEQLIETAEGEETKRYIHHYSFPPYSVGETGRVGSPNRREIGHGALGERALMPVIPSEEEFPYTIRVVSEVLSSNGSTSQASVCGSTLSLMDAGVPIKAPVAGIAMGLIVESEKKFSVLTDIIGLEDANGDMDFKVAGTKDGITALQLDVKTLQLTLPILEKALAQAKVARMTIMKVLTDAIAEPRPVVSTYAPKIKVLKINTEKIGELIGPGGKMIRKIIAETGALIDVEDDGTVNISGMTAEEVDAAVKRVEALTKEVKAGEVYEGEVKRLQPFGAFVEILPGKEGLVHVSDMAKEFVKDPADIVQLGDKVTVRVKEIDDFGRVNLSMNLDASADAEKHHNGGNGGGRDRFPRRGGMGGGRGGFNRDREGGRDFNRRDRGDFNRDSGRDFRDKDRSSGPHFPTSRLIDDSNNKKKFSR